MTANWLDSADYDAWRTTEVVDVGTFGMHWGEDDGDVDNSLDWTDAEMESAVPALCPECHEELQNDPADPSVGIMHGVVYCENDACAWEGATY